MIRTAVVGATGYTGAELVHILLHHPTAGIVGLFASADRDAAEPFDQRCPRFRNLLDLPLQPASPDAIAALRPDAVFLALPHEASPPLAADLLDRGCTVFDLSGAFRLKDPDLYPRFYRFRHPCPDLLSRAAYGLPEINRDAIAHADLVAVPGCYPTSAILPLHPLVHAGAIPPNATPVVDSISGVSGAGRAPKPHTSFCEVSLSAYSPLDHRHAPEIAAYAGTPVRFVPHLAPIDRGILTTIHTPLADGWSLDAARETLHAAYDDEPFIRILPPGDCPHVAHVQRANFCDIALHADPDSRHLVLLSAIDNLVKGAAGQAVQCLNLRFALPETAGLLPDTQDAPIA